MSLIIGIVVAVVVGFAAIGLSVYVYYIRKENNGLKQSLRPASAPFDPRGRHSQPMSKNSPQYRQELRQRSDTAPYAHQNLGSYKSKSQQSLGYHSGSQSPVDLGQSAPLPSSQYDAAANQPRQPARPPTYRTQDYPSVQQVQYQLNASQFGYSADSGSVAPSLYSANSRYSPRTPGSLNDPDLYQDRATFGINWSLFSILFGALAESKFSSISHLGNAGLDRNGNKIPTRFDYRQTFKFPFYTNADPAPVIPYFNHSGEVFIADNLVRISPSLANKQGLLWCKTPNPHKEWMVEFSFTVYGRGVAGGKGFAFWYTKDLEAPAVSPDFYGHVGSFNGVAIVFDSADPVSNRINPFIYAIENNGAKTARDFANYGMPSVHLAACFREYRNTPGHVYAKVTYKDNTLSLDIDIRQNGQAYTNCFSAPVNLPTGYHFGLSAQTAHTGLDDHDVYSFETYELYPAGKEKHFRPHEQEDISQGREFKLDEQMIEKIEKYEKEIHHQEETVAEGESFNEEELPAFNPELILKLEENQFHILAAINSIEDKLGITTANHAASASQTGLEARIKEELQALRSELSDLKADLQTLHTVTSQMARSAEVILNGIDGKINQAGSLLDRAHQNSSSLGTAVKIFAGLAGFALVALVFSTCVRAASSDARSKKFV
ncbi:hypothetical protein HDV03_004423 [Kappamyces sp. JEL0829]|nr:hypothetical protein HDV03_004423 [Kappamyces sp. JEL0829]